MAYVICNIAIKLFLSDMFFLFFILWNFKWHLCICFFFENQEENELQTIRHNCNRNRHSVQQSSASGGNVETELEANKICKDFVTYSEVIVLVMRF